MGLLVYVYIHICYDESLLPSLGILLYLVDTQYAQMKWYCVLGNWAWLGKSLLPRLSLWHAKYLVEMVSCLRDLLGESLLPSLVCCCAQLACNIYLDEMSFGRFCSK